MGFIIRTRLTEGGPTTDIVVRPHPSSVEYPERRLFSREETPDGATIIQRPLIDTRPRKWIWENYRSNIPGYEALWQQLLTTDYRYRLQNGLYPYVEIWEDETGAGGFERYEEDGVTKLFTRVKVVQITRNEVRAGGNYPVFENSVFEFHPSDSSYSEF